MAHSGNAGPFSAKYARLQVDAGGWNSCCRQFSGAWLYRSAIWNVD